MKRKRGPCDGEIYEAVSRKANPELHAELDRLLKDRPLDTPSFDDLLAADRAKLKNGDKDWTSPCLNCDAVPTMHPTKLCGPCGTGEAETAGGNW